MNRAADGVLDFGPDEIRSAVRAVQARSSQVPRIAFILGSGLGAFADTFADRTAVPYSSIPGFPRPTVEGHEGNLVLGRVAGVEVVAQQGRFHPYEGYAATQVAFPLRVMQALGARVLVVTNAAGAAHPRFRPGDLMLIEDQVNFQFRSPLRGTGPLVDDSRFVDLAEPFSRRLLDAAEETGRELGIRLARGVYWGNPGPAYETPAEVSMIRRLGGDAVGMSTVAEVITAAHLGMETLGVTCISNLAAGLAPQGLDHAEVLEVTGRVREQFIRLLTALIHKL